MKNKGQDEYVNFLYWGCKILSYFLIFFGLVALITGFPDKFWAFLLIPSGFVGIAWTRLFKREAERDD